VRACSRVGDEVVGGEGVKKDRKWVEMTKRAKEEELDRAVPYIRAMKREAYAY
jgi:hypothetical protein